jgi:hypothetical protein
MTADVNLWDWGERFAIFRHTNVDRHQEPRPRDDTKGSEGGGPSRVMPTPLLPCDVGAQPTRAA